MDEAVLGVVREAVESGWWSMGPRVEELEALFGELTGASHVLAVSSGTAALHLALLGVGCGPGDEVVLPSLNFVAAANAITRLGATPVFCDVTGMDDLNLDPADLDAAIGPRTKAVVAFHYGGYACDLDAVIECVEGRGIAIVEDAAHAPGATWRGRALGTIGDVGCFSFFANKNVPAGEGGAIVTSNSALAERMRLLRSHGMTAPTWQRHHGHSSTYDVVDAGFNFRLDELHAALARLQLDRLADANAARRERVLQYRALLAGVDGLSFPFPDAASVESSAHHLVVVVLPSGAVRAAVRGALSDERIQTSIHYPPTHRFTAYADVGARRPLPRTDDLTDRILTLPLFAHMPGDDVEIVADALARALAASPATIGQGRTKRLR